MDIYCIVFYLLLAVLGLLLAGMYYMYRIARAGKCESVVELDGKTVIVTGANIGIGKETAKDMAKRGATVVLACRNLENGNIASQEIKESSDNLNVFVRKLDLNSLTSVKEFAENFLQEFKKLHILINNAGVMLCPYGETEDGFETHFGVNHLGHFALTNLLLERIAECSPSRIVNLTSKGHFHFACMELDDLNWKKRSYSKAYAYNQSKLANIMFTKELHKRLADKNITSYAVHPGVVNTELTRYMSILHFLGKNFTSLIQLVFKTPEEGAQTSIYCAVDENVLKDSGKYFENCKATPSSKMSYDEGLAKKLWEKSEQLTGINCPL